MAFRDYYDVLGVKRDASEKDIKKAYRKLATEHHPDKTKGDKRSEEKFKEISEAYQVLGNVEKRKQYNELGSDWPQFQQSGISYEDFVAQRQRYQQYQGQSRGQRQYSSSGSSWGDGDFSDIFEGFFQGGRQNPFQGSRRPRAGSDVSGEITISLMEAYQGTQRLLDVNGNTIKLDIKPGAYDGLKLRAKGKGQKGDEGHAGDLYILIHVAGDAAYERRGNDLHKQQWVDVFDLMLGGEVDLETPSGKVTMKIKEATQNQKTVRLKGKGMPVYGKKDTYGDLLVTLIAKLPDQLSDLQREWLNKAREAF